MDESLRELERQFSQTPNEVLRRHLATAYRRQGRLLDAWRLIRDFENCSERRELSLAMWEDQKSWFDARPGSRDALVQLAPNAIGGLQNKASPIYTLLKNRQQGHILGLEWAPPSSFMKTLKRPDLDPDLPFMTSFIGRGQFVQREEVHSGLTDWLSELSEVETVRLSSNLDWWPLLPHWPAVQSVTARTLLLQSFGELSRFPKLKQLIVGTFTLLTSVDSVPDLPPIQHIEIGRILRPEQYLLFALLPKIRTLESLTLGFSLHFDELDTLSHFQKLRQLTLSKESISANWLKTLSPLRQLSSLTLSRCSISPEALSLISQFPRLQSLSLRDTDFQNQSLCELSSLGELENLELTRTNIDNEVLTELKRLPALKRLWIRECRALDSDCTLALGDISQLEEIDCYGTAVDLSKLREIRPDVTINSPKNQFKTHSPFH